MIRPARIRQTTRAAQRSGGGLIADGVDALVRDFTRAADSIRPAAGPVVVKTVGKAAATMGDLIPRRTSRTADSVTADDEATIDGFVVSAAAGPDRDADDQAFVARFIEYGTESQPPRPFLEQSITPYLDAFADELADVAANEVLGP